MTAESFAQIVANEVAKKLAELSIEIPEGGTRAIAIDETSGAGILVTLSPGLRARASTAATSPQFPRLRIARPG